jgi:hypothetical protein
MGVQDWHIEFETDASGNFAVIQHKTCGARTRFNIDLAAPGSMHYCTCGAGMLISAESLQSMRQLIAQARKFLRK